MRGDGVKKPARCLEEWGRSRREDEKRVEGFKLNQNCSSLV